MSEKPPREAAMALAAEILARAVCAILPPGFRFCLFVMDGAGTWAAQGESPGVACLDVARTALRDYDAQPKAAAPTTTIDRKAN